MDLELICQWVIFTLVPISIWLLTRNSKKLQFWGCFIGLLAQPCFYYSYTNNSQFGMLAVTVWYTGCFIDGLIKKKQSSGDYN